MINALAQTIYHYRGTLWAMAFSCLFFYTGFAQQWLPDPKGWFVAEEIPVKTPEKPVEAVQSIGSVAPPVKRESPWIRVRARVESIQRVTLPDTSGNSQTTHTVAKMRGNDEETYYVILPHEVRTVQAAELQFPIGRYLFMGMLWAGKIEGVDYYKWDGGDYVPLAELNG